MGPSDPWSKARGEAYFGRGILRHAPLFSRVAASARGVVGTGRCGCYAFHFWDKPEVVPPMVEDVWRSVFWEGHPPACPTFQPRSGVGARRGGDGAGWLLRVSFLGQAEGCPSHGRRRAAKRILGGASSGMPHFSAAKRRRRAAWWGRGGVVATRFILGTSRRLSLPWSHAQFVNLSLIGPLLCFLAMAVAHGVVVHIVPFLIVALAGAESLVPELSLPKGTCVFG